MDTDNPVRCPHLLSMDFHDNLVASSLSNLIGTYVEFQCSGTKPILSGPSAIRCRTSGKWNDTLPTCMTADDGESTRMFTEEVSITPTPTMIPDEQEVETVLIVLWIAGGLLLMTLLILIGCILRTHKKQRNSDSSGRFPSQGQGNPRHGGVNPTFTSYDEIWTWIPVVTENADNCRSQARGATSGRANMANESNNDSTRNQRLPSYNEAITNTAANRTVTQNATRHPPTHQTAAGPSHSSANQTTLQIRPFTNTTNQASVGDRDANRSSRSQDVRQTQSSRTNHVTTETNQYETIPADQNSRPLTNGNNVTYVSVTSSSGSALQQARDLVNRASAHAHRPLPSAPVLQNTNRHEPHTNHRQHSRPSDSTGNSSSNPTRTTSSSITQPVYLPRYSHQAPQDFNHSNNSMFTYIGDHAHRARSHPPFTSQDGPPPPYSITRTSEQPVSSSRTSASVVATSLLRGLESHYF